VSLSASNTSPQVNDAVTITASGTNIGPNEKIVVNYQGGTSAPSGPYAYGQNPSSVNAVPNEVLGAPGSSTVSFSITETTSQSVTFQAWVVPTNGGNAYAQATPVTVTWHFPAPNTILSPT